MEQLTQFLTEHWILSLAFVALALLVGASFLESHFRGVRKLSPMAATELINREGAIVIDVGPQGEFEQGHILNALHVPMASLNKELAKLEQYREQPILMSCRSGQSSASAGMTLSKQGFSHIHVLGGGTLAWQNANLPLSRK